MAGDEPMVSEWEVWACGFAAVPSFAIDPPQRAASPAVPAIIGSASTRRRIEPSASSLSEAYQSGVHTIIIMTP